jgi:excinuclease ABC subunit C
MHTGIFYTRGQAYRREHFIFEGVGDVDNRELMTSFISSSMALPHLYASDIAPEDIDELNIIERWLSDKSRQRCI